MSQKIPYRLSFYESGYIDAKEFNAKVEAARRNWEEDAILLAKLYRKGLFDDTEKIDVDKMLTKNI